MMSSNNYLKSLLVFTGSFVGGITAGLLLAPNSGAKNRRWLNLKIKDFSEWASYQKRMAKISSEKEWNNLQKICSPRRNIPNLYQATAGLTFHEYHHEDE